MGKKIIIGTLCGLVGLGIGGVCYNQIPGFRTALNNAFQINDSKGNINISSDNIWEEKLAQLQVDLNYKIIENEQLRSEVKALEQEKQALIDSGVSLELIEELNTEINTLNEQITSNQNIIDSLNSRCVRLVQILNKTATEVFADDLEGLTKVSEQLFYKMNTLTRIELPSTLQVIEKRGFWACSKLESVDFSRCSNLTTIGIDAFQSCSSLKSLDLSNCTKLTSIDNNAFKSCSKLNSVKLPDSITTLGSYCFDYCTGLTSIDLSNCINLKNFDAIFEYCTNLSEVILPDTIDRLTASFINSTNFTYNIYENCKYLGSKDNPYFALIGLVDSSVTSVSIHSDVEIFRDSALAYSKTLTNIDLSNCSKLTKIPYVCFANGSTITSIKLPSTITSIDGSAFRNCTALTELIITSDSPPILDGTELSIPDTVTIYVHNVEVYRTMQGWSELPNNFVEIE